MDIELGTFSRVNTGVSSFWKEASGLLNSLIVPQFLCNRNGLPIALHAEEKLPRLQSLAERGRERREALEGLAS